VHWPLSGPENDAACMIPLHVGARVERSAAVRVVTGQTPALYLDPNATARLVRGVSAEVAGIKCNAGDRQAVRALAIRKFLECSGAVARRPANSIGGCPARRAFLRWSSSAPQAQQGSSSSASEFGTTRDSLAIGSAHPTCKAHQGAESRVGGLGRLVMADGWKAGCPCLKLWRRGQGPAGRVGSLTGSLPSRRHHSARARRVRVILVVRDRRSECGGNRYTPLHLIGLLLRSGTGC
jgi:hypothetical protein